MQFMLMLYIDQSGWTRLTAAQQQEGLAAYSAYVEALTKAGAFVGTGRLAMASTAATVRLKDGAPQVLDGPFAQSKEQLAGYFLVDAPDMDAALAWAARCPAAGHGVVEVRPLQ